MVRSVTFLVAVFAVLLAAGALAKPPQGKGPAEKATGKVQVDVRGWWLDFNAHEAKDGRPAKGEALAWSDEVGRTIELTVKYVKVEGNEAWFAAQATSDTFGTLVGRWLFVYCMDGGSPGSKDQIAWDWDSGTDSVPDAASRVDAMETPNNLHTIIEGNLVVHADN
jgi:hypothetical protein